MVECTRGRERVCVARLDLFRYFGGWYPTKKVDTRPAAQKRKANPRKKPRHRVIALVPGYIFLKADDPLALRDVLEAYTGTLWMRLLIIGGTPVALTDDDMAQMKQVPRRVAQLVEDVKRRQREEWEAKRPKIGMPAKITDGALSGASGVVKDIRNGTVRLDLALMGFVTVPEEKAERVA